MQWSLRPGDLFVAKSKLCAMSLTSRFADSYDNDVVTALKISVSSRVTKIMTLASDRPPADVLWVSDA